MTHPSFRDAPDFTYRPDPAGFHVYVQARGHAPHWQHVSTLPVAVTLFVETALPVVEDATAVVTDGCGTVVLGYDTRKGENMGYGQWFGVRAAFAVLERMVDPLEAAIWEVIAREAAEG